MLKTFWSYLDQPFAESLFAKIGDEVGQVVIYGMSWCVYVMGGRTNCRSAPIAPYPELSTASHEHALQIYAEAHTAVTPNVPSQQCVFLIIAVHATMSVHGESLL